MKMEKQDGGHAEEIQSQFSPNKVPGKFKNNHFNAGKSSRNNQDMQAMRERR
jgi:hypothetical protein